tara:strand:+ start:2194 stop:2766 length:573 start_codon:yes stop_codon:yes gene_type:complete
MNTLKKISFPFLSLFLLYRSIELTRSLTLSKPNEYSNIEALLISFLLTLFITGIFAFIGFAYSSSKILPDRYYEIKNPRVLNYTSKVLGIKYFRVLVLFFFWGKKNNQKKYFNGTKKGLHNFIYQTKQSEFGHLGALLLILVLTIYLLAHKYYFLTLIITLINILGNLYPIILQRTHRIRIAKITKHNTI